MLNWLQPDSESFLFEPHPVLLVSVYGDDYLFKDVRIGLTEVVFEEGVTIGVVFVEFLLALS